MDDIRVGGVYVNNFRGIAKRVLSIDRWSVEYTAYVLANGAELMTSRCSILYFLRWAEREATQAECDILGKDVPDTVGPMYSALSAALRNCRRPHQG